MTEPDRVDKFIAERNKQAAARPNPLELLGRINADPLGGVTVNASGPYPPPKPKK